MNLLLADTDAPLTPTDSPGGGTYGSTQSVTLSDPTSAAIFYTVDGSTPACPATGTLYTIAISISVTTTLKAIGCNGITGGGVLTSVYTISGGGGISLVTHTVAGCTSNSGITTSGINTTGSSLFIVITSAFNAAATLTSSPSAGTFTALTAPASQSSMFLKVYYIYAPTTSGSQTFTATSTNACIAVLAFSGTAGSSVDQQAAGTLGAGTSTQAGSITPGSNNEVVISGLGERNNVTGLAINSGFTLEDSISNAAGNIGIGSAFLIQTTATAANPTWSWTTSISNAAINASFQ